MRSFGRLLASALGVLLVAATLHAQTSQVAALYKEALAREGAIRKQIDTLGSSALPAPILGRIRTLVGAYQDLSRLFPKSGYSDNALWQGAMLSADAFWQFGEAQDRTTAIRLLRALNERFPNSSLLKQVPAQLDRLQNARATASARAPSPRLTEHPAPTVVERSVSGTSILRAIRREALPDALRITLELDREEPFHYERIGGPPRVFIDLQNTRAVEALRYARLSYGDDVVKQIRVGRQLNTRTRVVLDLQNAGRYSVYELYDPYRIVIDFERGATTPLEQVAPASPPTLAARATPAARPIPRPAPTPRSPALLSSRLPAVRVTSVPAVVVKNDVTPIPEEHAAPGPIDVAVTSRRDRGESSDTPAPPTAPSANSRGGFSLSRQLGLGISRIVIDPGHGGHDPGAKTAGLTEADLVLDVALRLQKLLRKQPGVEVVMTRQDDTYVPLEQRTAIANRAGADLFLSIHANASENPAARGIETYFLNFAPNPEAEAIAARENAGVSATMGRLPDIVKAIALHNKMDESRDFATAVQASLYQRLRRTNRDTRSLGVKQAPFMVLIGATMPSILAEISFITNREEAARLKSDKYRQQIADALLEGILRYQQSLKHGAGLVSQTQ
jgi:N-acetylmuramoyl-L-alanine amidase